MPGNRDMSSSSAHRFCFRSDVLSVLVCSRAAVLVPSGLVVSEREDAHAERSNLGSIVAV